MFTCKHRIASIASLVIASLMVKKADSSHLQIHDTEVEEVAAAAVDVNSNKEFDEFTSRAMEEEEFLTCGAYDGAPCCRGFKCKESRLACDRVNDVCVSCGASGLPEDPEICCDGMKCEGGAVCSIDGLCLACGIFGAPCCKGEALSCDEDLWCDITGTCVSCGSLSEPCCDGMNCGGLAGKGDIPLTCNHLNTCVQCGSTSEPCCPGMKCNQEIVTERRLETEEKGTEALGRVCAPNGLCAECGLVNHPCCADGKPCYDDLICNGNGLCDFAPVDP